jgi:hypothetical protein
LRGFNTHLQHIASRRNFKFSREHALEVAHAYRHTIGKNRERELLAKVLRNPNAQANEMKSIQELQ